MQQLSPSVLAEIVDRAVRNVKERKVFAENLRMSLAITHTNSYQKTAMNFLLSKQSMKDIQEMEMQKSFMANIMQQLLQSQLNSSVEFLGMQQHYWHPKLLTVCLHTLSNKNTLPKAVII